MRTWRNTAWSVKRMRRGNILSVVRQEMKDFLVVGKQYLIHRDEGGGKNEINRDVSQYCHI